MYEEEASTKKAPLSQSSEEPFFLYDGWSEERNKVLNELLKVVQQPKRDYDMRARILKKFTYALLKSAATQKEEKKVFVAKVPEIKIPSFNQVESRIPIPDDISFLIPKPKKSY